MLALVALLCVAEPTDAVARAETLAAEGLALFERDPRSAAALFERAFELSGRPAPLRNAARAYEAAGEPTRAADAWERYAAHPELDPERAQPP